MHGALAARDGDYHLVLPARLDLADVAAGVRAVLHMEEHGGIVLGADGHLGVVLRAQGHAGVGLDGFQRLFTGLVEDLEVRQDLGDAQAGDEFNKVYPMGADVRKGAGLSAGLGSSLQL